MPPKRSQKYLPARGKKTPKLFKPVLGDKITATYLYVEWNVPSNVTLSARRWEILTSSLCYAGALSPSKFPGHATLELPILKIVFNETEIFNSFQVQALLTPFHSAYRVAHVTATAGFAQCIVTAK